MILNVLILLVGFALLIYGGNMVINGATTLATKLKIPSIIIGLTIVAFGTSIPELFVTMIAASEGAGELVFSDIIGSNIANTLLVLGLAAVICPLFSKTKIIRRNFLYLVLTSIAFWILVDRLFIGQDMIVLSRASSLVLLAIFIFFVFSLLRRILRSKGNDLLILEYKKFEEIYIKNGMTLLSLTVGFALLYFGAKFVVDNALFIAAAYGLSEGFAGIFIVSIGTSLPEIATIITAGLKKENDVVLGNIIGTNIFNLAFVLGVAGVTYGLTAHAYLRIDILVLIGATLLLYYFVIKDKEIKRQSGFLMIALYVLYLIYVFQRG